MPGERKRAKLFADACRAALAAFVFGLFSGHTIIERERGRWDFAEMVLAVGFLIFALLVLLGTQHAVRPLATSEPPQKSARQFLFSCALFALISSTFGMFVSGLIWYSCDFIRTFGAVFWGAITCVAIYPVRRDAKRLADAASPSRSLSGPTV